MAELVELIKQYPLLFGIIGVVFFILVVIILVLGGTIKTPWFEIGGRRDNESTPSPQSPTINQSPSIQQSPSINIFSGITSEQLDELVEQRTKTIRKETNEKPPSFLYQPTELPERIMYIYRARHDIESKIGGIAVGWVGGWPGVSMADFGTFFGLAQENHLISEQLANDIGSFFSFTQEFVNQGDVNDDAFLNIQYLAASINLGLDYYMKKVENNPESTIYQRIEAEKQYGRGQDVE